MVTVVFRAGKEDSPPVVVPWRQALDLARSAIAAVERQRATAQTELVQAEIRRRERANTGWLRRHVLRPLSTDAECVRNELMDPPNGDTLGNDEWLLTEVAAERVESAAERIRTAALIAPAGSAFITVRQSDWDDVLHYTNQ